MKKLMVSMSILGVSCLSVCLGELNDWSKGYVLKPSTDMVYSVKNIKSIARDIRIGISLRSGEGGRIRAKVLVLGVNDKNRTNPRTCVLNMDQSQEEFEYTLTNCFKYSIERTFVVNVENH